MPLPELIIPGASRSGTSFLFHLLKQHPDIFLPKEKELQFFEKDKEYEKGIAHYEQNFNHTTQFKLRAESSPPYFHKGITINNLGSHNYDVTNDSITRIQQHIPNVKILITLRNPIERLFSQFFKNYFQEKEKETLETALDLEIEGVRTFENSPLCWLYKNSYSIHLKHWLNHFPKENIKVILFEDWTKNHRIINEEVMDFLNVDHFQFDYNVQKNTGNSYAQKRKWKFSYKDLFKHKKYPKLDAVTFEKVKKLLHDDILICEQLLNLDLENWLKYEKD